MIIHQCLGEPKHQVTVIKTEMQIIKNPSKRKSSRATADSGYDPRKLPLLSTEVEIDTLIGSEGTTKVRVDFALLEVLRSVVVETNRSSA